MQEDGLRLTGTVVFLKLMKPENGKPYKSVQVMTNGGRQRAMLREIKDYSGRDYDYGKKYTFEVMENLNTNPKTGKTYFSWYCWGNDGAGESSAPASSPPPASSGGHKI